MGWGGCDLAVLVGVGCVWVATAVGVLLGIWVVVGLGVVVLAGVMVGVGTAVSVLVGVGETGAVGGTSVGLATELAVAVGVLEGVAVGGKGIISSGVSAGIVSRKFTRSSSAAAAMVGSNGANSKSKLSP